MIKYKLLGLARQNRSELQRFMKFAVVGGIGLVIDYTILNVLAHVLNVDERIAIAIAFGCAAVSNFVWNRVWVYPESRSERKRKLLPIFMAVNAIGLGINELTLFLLYAPLSALMNSSFLGLNVTKAFGAVIVMMWNFFVNRFVTFRNVKWAGAGTVNLAEIDSAL